MTVQFEPFKLQPFPRFTVVSQASDDLSYRSHHGFGHWPPCFDCSPTSRLNIADILLQGTKAQEAYFNPGKANKACFEELALGEVGVGVFSHLILVGISIPLSHLCESEDPNTLSFLISVITPPASYKAIVERFVSIRFFFRLVGSLIEPWG